MSTTREMEKVAAWPRISATVRPDGTGAITLNGTERPCAAASVDELRTGMIARCVALARSLRRPVRLTVTEGTSTWPLAVRAEGVVQLIDDDGAIRPADGLAAHEGRCRVCRRPQPVTATTCTQCNVEEPHRVEELHRGEAGPIGVPDDAVPGAADLIGAPDEADPLGVPDDVVPDVVDAPGALDEADPIGTRDPGARTDAAGAVAQTAPEGPAEIQPESPTARTLHLAFSTQPAVTVAGGVALGRNPAPIGGRRPIRVASPKRMLSRTHALIDVDDGGRIVVTDHHSGNGTEAQTQPPTRLTPGTPYVVHDGATLLLGDVAVLVKFA